MLENLVRISLRSNRETAMGNTIIQSEAVSARIKHRYQEEETAVLDNPETSHNSKSNIKNAEKDRRD